MPTVNEQWRKIVAVHQHLKRVTILAEEFSADSKAFLQPINEQKNALDHIIRAQARRIDASASDDDDDYVLGQLGKAVGHTYRAFFDAADWFGIAIRDRVSQSLSPYDNSTIKAAIPHYYDQLRPRLDAACRQIAELRNQKDVENRAETVLDEVRHYGNVLEDLLNIHEAIAARIPALEEHHQKAVAQSNTNTAERTRSAVLAAVLGATVGALLTGLLIWILG